MAKGLILVNYILKIIEKIVKMVKKSDQKPTFKNKSGHAFSLKFQWF